MATLYWFGGSGNWDSTTTSNWSTVAPTAFTGTMVGTTALTAAAVTGTALAIGKTVKNCDGSYTGIIVSGVAPNWVMDTSGTFATACGAGTAAGVAPTSADDVIFDPQAGDTLTSSSYINIGSSAASKNFTTTTGVNTIFWDVGGAVAVYGNCNIGANFTYLSTSTSTIAINMMGGTAGTTVTIAKTGVIASLNYQTATTYTQNAVFVNATSTSGITAVLGTVTVAGAMSTGILSISNGASMTTGAFTHTISYQVQSYNGSTFNVTGSTFNIGAAGAGTAFWVVDAGTTFTNSAATVINIGSSTLGLFSEFDGGGKSYLGTVNIIGSSAVITGANTFVTFTRTGNADALSYLYLFANQTCTGVFTVQGNSVAPNRLYVGSDTTGTARTLTLSGATKTLKWVDFADITFSITGAAPTQTLTGDCLGNSGLSLTTAITCYAKTGATAFNYSGAMWFTTSGGAVAARVPLPQDTVVFDVNTGAGAVTVDCRVLGKDVSFNAWTGSFTSPTYSYPWVYGNVSGTSIGQLSFGITFGSRTNITLSATLPTSNSYYFYGWGATFTLAGNFIQVGAQSLVVQGCTLNTATYNVTITGISNYSSLSPSTAGVYTINGGGITATSGTITIASNGIARFYNFTPGTSSVVLSPSSSLEADPGGTCSLYGLVFSGNGTFFVSPGRSLSYNSWSNTGTTSGSIIALFTATHTITNFNVTSISTASILIGYNLGGTITQLASSAVQASIALVNTATPSFVLFKSVAVTGAALSPVGVANMGNNSGISFASNVRGYAITTGTGSFTPPANISTSNAVIVFGAGGSGAKRTTASAGSGGGASGSMAVSYNLPITSATTIYYDTTGGTTWVNVVSNVAPTLVTQGARAYAGASASTTSTAGASASASTPVGRFGSLGRNGEAGSGASSGSGAAAPSLTYRQGYFAGGTSSSAGGGGGGQKSNAAGAIGTTGAAGGQNLLGVAAAGGTSGNAGTAGTLGGGGGGGGAAASGGAATNNAEFSYSFLNGASSSGTIGSSGGAGGTGGNASGVAPAGAAADYAGGGAGGAGGSSVANNSAGGAGGSPLIVFLYTYVPTAGTQAIFIG